MHPGTSAVNLTAIAAHSSAAPLLKSTVHTATVLTSWKEIARYMGKGVRTVQRWEQDFGLPVRRPQGSNKKAVLARPRDLDAWVAMRCSSRAELSLHLPVINASFESLSTLASSIETFRELRSSNRALLGEVTTAAKALRREVVTALSILGHSQNSARSIQ